MDLRVEGTDQLHTVYKELKRVGDVDLKKSLTKAIRESTKPMKDAVKASALAKLPKRGGLAALVANSRVTNKVKTGSRTAGVNIKASNVHQIASMNRGRLRAPTFGNKRLWHTQSVPTGWFSDPIEANAPEVQRAVLDALQKTAHQLSNNGPTTHPKIGS